MDQFAFRLPHERAPFFTETAARLQVSDIIIAKDFWVCWTLKNLFALENGPRLLFKGGTSLSKAYGLIYRFSEDVDITVRRHDLGFAEDRDVLRGLSGKARDRWIGRLTNTCEEYIAGSLLPALQEALRSVLGDPGDDSWRLELDTDNPETLSFGYPASNLPGQDAYVARAIKIEFGARGESWPAGLKDIRPYVAQEYPDEFSEPACEITTLDAERTFWEKIAALHGWYHENKPERAARKSRHYYDVFALARSPLQQRALGRLDLLRDVADHKCLFFRSAWAKYDEATPGTLRLVPQSELRAALEADYRGMNEMFFRDPPSFADVMAELEALEDEINSLGI